MVLSCDYNECLNSLTGVATVVDDAMSNEDTKNIIFSISRTSGVRFIGVSRLITHKLTLPVENYTLQLDESDGEEILIQLKSKEIISFLNAYKGVRRTTVEEVIFELTERGQVKCTVVEQELEEDTEFGEEPRKHTSSWVFNQVPIKPNMLATIRMELPEGIELTSVSKDNILFHTRNMLPVMQNVTSMYGKLMFDEKYVVAFGNAYTVVMSNMLPISGVSLSYKAVSFIDKIICVEDFIQVGKTQTHMYFKTDLSESFIQYESKLANYQPYIDMFVKEHAVSLDRIYLKDVLKRFSLVDDNIECSIKADDDIIGLRNSRYEQELDLLQKKAMDEFGVVKFKILPAVLDKAIIGSDAEFSQELFIYYNKDSGVLVFSDDSGAWFTVVRVKIG